MKYAVVAPVLNESIKIRRVVDRIHEAGIEAVLVVDDGSSDDSADVVESRGARVLRVAKTRGVGRALVTGIRQLKREGFDICVIIAGNDKDDPRQIERLLAPLQRDEADFVQGSRWLDGGKVGGDMSILRRFATRLHPWLFSLAVGKRLTESTNGFRAFRLSIIDDLRMDLEQDWLDGYEMEPYLLFKVIKLGYRHVEVPCTKIYPPKSEGVTKMRPVLDWWNIMRPIFLLGLGLRR